MDFTIDFLDPPGCAINPIPQSLGKGKCTEVVCWSSGLYSIQASKHEIAHMRYISDIGDQFSCKEKG